MLTPQEVSERAFPKASFGGYNMGQVDEFLDILTADYTSLYNENAVLKSKMKVLVEKVEEYRVHKHHLAQLTVVVIDAAGLGLHPVAHLGHVLYVGLLHGKASESHGNSKGWRIPTRTKRTMTLRTTTSLRPGL